MSCIVGAVSSHRLLLGDKVSCLSGRSGAFWGRGNIIRVAIMKAAEHKNEMFVCLQYRSDCFIPFYM